MLPLPLPSPAATPSASTQLALLDWLLHSLASHQNAQKWMQLPQPLWGAPPQPAGGPADARFAHPSWQRWPFSALHERHQVWGEQLVNSAKLDGMVPHHQQLMAFMARQWTELTSPANWPWSNPEVSEKAVSTLGMSWLKGLHLWLGDLPGAVSQGVAALAREQSPPATPQDLPPLTHEVGQDVAITPGKVVMRNHLVELIQYAPSTKAVAREPVLIVPSCIMKYYILDLSPHNSMVKHLRDQGLTVFMLSWRNPDENDRDLGLDDYIRLGLLDSMAAIRRLTGCEELHTMGYCLGGTFLAMAASLLARQAPDSRIRLDDLPRLRSMTLLAAQTDFSEPGDLGVFIDPDQVTHLREDMARRGFLSGRQMAAAFQLLNARDLIWSRMTQRYLLGEDENGMDLMSWNADATRLPARMHGEYLNELFLRNALATGHARVLGERVALIDIQCPVMVVGTEKDQVSPWRSVHKLTLLTDTDTTFVLAAGGHNAGIVSEPGHPHRHHAVRHAPQGSTWLAPDDWLAAAERRDGSWWPTWVDWLKAHSSDAIAARPIPDEASLCDAPGTYVQMRHAD